MSSRFVSRFCVGDPDGRHSSVWRVWKHTSTSKSDIFISPRNVAGLIKASLHESGVWRFAFSSEYAQREFGDDHHIYDSRLIAQWERPNEIAQGVSLAFRIVIPESDLEIYPLSRDEASSIDWIDPPSEDGLVEIVLIITKSNVHTTDWPGKNGMGTLLLSSSTLPNGETLWLVYLYGQVQDEWILDRARFKSQLHQIKPRFTHALGLLKSGNPRIMAMGFYPDGSRYFMDLAAKEFVGIGFIVRAIYWSSVDWVMKKIKKLRMLLGA